MTSTLVSKVARLRLYTKTYTRKDKCKGRYPFKKRSSEHKREQQKCSTLKGQTMAMKDNSGDHNDQEENNKERRWYTQGNQKKHNKEERGCSSIEKRGWSNLRRRWSGVHRRKNLCIKQQKDQEGNFKEES